MMFGTALPVRFTHYIRSSLTVFEVMEAPYPGYRGCNITTSQVQLSIPALLYGIENGKQCFSCKPLFIILK